MSNSEQAIHQPLNVIEQHDFPMFEPGVHFWLSVPDDILLLDVRRGPRWPEAFRLCWRRDPAAPVVNREFVWWDQGKPFPLVWAFIGSLKYFGRRIYLLEVTVHGGPVNG